MGSNPTRTLHHLATGYQTDLFGPESLWSENEGMSQLAEIKEKYLEVEFLNLTTTKSET